MHELELLDPSRLLSDLGGAVEHREEGKVLHRLHCLLLVASGFDCRRLGEGLGRDPRTLERWAHRYGAQGVEGLRDRKMGRPGRLDGERLQALRRDLAQPPKRLGYGLPAWNGALLAEHIERRFGVCLGVRQSQRLLRLLRSEQNESASESTPSRK